MYIERRLDWLHFLSRDTRKLPRQPRRSSRQIPDNIAQTNSRQLSRIPRKTQESQLNLADLPTFPPTTTSLPTITHAPNLPTTPDHIPTLSSHHTITSADATLAMKTNAQTPPQPFSKLLLESNRTLAWDAQINQPETSSGPASFCLLLVRHCRVGSDSLTAAVLSSCCHLK